MSTIFGFPVINDQGQGSPVWIDVRRTGNEEPGEIWYWAEGVNEPLLVKVINNAYGEQNVIFRNKLEAIRTGNLKITLYGPQELFTNDGNIIEIDGESFGALLFLAKTNAFRVPENIAERQNADKILISAEWHPEAGGYKYVTGCNGKVTLAKALRASLYILSDENTQDNADGIFISKTQGEFTTSIKQATNNVQTHADEYTVGDAQPGEIGYAFKEAVFDPNTEGNNIDYLNRILNRSELNPILRYDQGAFNDGLLKTLMATPENREQFFYVEDRQPANILIAGPTGSGKTFISHFAMLNTMLVEKRLVIFVAPVKALANEVFNEFVAKYVDGTTLTKEEVILSTGDDRINDGRINREPGSIKLIVTVYEKASLFIGTMDRMLNHVGLIVIDELHMLANKERGGVIDLLIAKVKNQDAHNAITPGAKPLRLLGITTENLIQDEQTPIVQAFYRHDTPPFRLITNRRPVPIGHELWFYGLLSKEDRNERKKAFEITVNDDSSRNIEMRDYAYRLNEFDRKNQLTDPKSVFDTVNLCNHIIDLSTEGNYKRILIVVDSINFGTSLAENIKSEEVEIDEKTSDKIKTSDISNYRKIETFAKKGVYIHNSSLPLELRELAENVFRQKPDENDNKTLYLISTETLAYGVNLSFDLVILTSLYFPRTGGNRELIDTNLYHNLLGRAGRPGFQGEPKAIVLLNMNNFRNNEILNRVYDLIKFYYSNTGENENKISSLISSDSFANKYKESLKDFTDPTIRAVLDTLGHQWLDNANGISSGRLQHYLTGTIFYQQDTGLFTEDTIRNVVIAKILEYALQENIDIVDKKNEDYRLTERGRALLETGTSWRAIVPLNAWVKLLNAEGNENSVHNEWGPEAILPALIATPDFWTSARAFATEEGKPSQKGMPKVRNIDGLLTWEGNNGREPIPISYPALILLERYINSESISLETNKADNPEDVFNRLLLALLLWVQGKSASTIQAVSGHKFDLRKSYTDKASWIARMFVRYLMDKKGSDLLPSVRYGLPLFAEQLHAGLPKKALPFHAALTGTDRLSRPTIMRLIGKGFMPSGAMLAEYDFPVDTDIARIISTKLEKGVPKYYGSVWEDMVYEILRDAPQIEDDIKKQIKNLFEFKFDLNMNANIYWDLPAAKNAAFNKLISIIQRFIPNSSNLGDNYIVEVEVEGNDFIKFQHNSFKVSVFWPWIPGAEPRTSGVCMSAASMVLFCMLIHRNFIDINKVKNCNTLQDTPTYLNVETLIPWMQEKELDVDGNAGDIPVPLMVAIYKYTECTDPGIPNLDD